MIRRVALSLLLVGCACKRSRPAAESELPVAPAVAAAPEPSESPEAKRWSWTAQSENGRASVTQRFVQAGTCHVESSGASPEWTADECFGDRDDFHFVSTDGARLMVLYSLPAVGDDWRTATVLSLYERGKLVAQTNARALVSDEDKLRMFSARFSWLAGINGAPGIAPRAIGGDMVEGAVTSGTHFRFGFDGAGIPVPVVPMKRTAMADDESGCGGMMEWTDASGDTHYTDSLQEVPKAYRKKVKCTEGGDISTVRGGIKPSRMGSSAFEPLPSVQVPGRPNAPPQPAAPTVFCRFAYQQKWKNTKDYTHVGTGTLMEYSFCTPGPLARAQQYCDHNARSGYWNAQPCLCTDDKTYIGTRCDQ